MFHAYNSLDILKILDSVEDYAIKNHKNWHYSKPRARALVMVLASSGISLLELNQLRIRNLENVEDCYCFHLEDRILFCSPETKTALDEYLKTRGNLEPNSKVFDLKYDAMRKILYRLVLKSKITNQIKHESWNGSFRNKLQTPGMKGIKLRYDSMINLNPTHTPQEQLQQYKKQVMQ